jgi:hypothetical protein
MTGDDDAVFDALVGLDRVSRLVAAVIDGAAPHGADRPPGLAEGMPDDLPDDLIDAVLGLVSLRTTVDLVLAALRCDTVDAGPVAPVAPGASDDAAWSRELLR